jgi:two-component system phosphate regulon sensor histidine kinase PhoR
VCSVFRILYYFCHALDFFNANYQSVFFWLWIALALALGGISVNLLWRKRQRKILQGLQLIIEEEKKITGGDAYRTPGDVEEALKAVFDARKTEMERMRLMETYRRDYIGNVAHELKTPIFTIQGYLDSVSEELEDSKPDMELVNTFISKAQKNTGRLGQIISDLDTITKYESGFLQLEYEAFNLHELVKDVIESLEIQAAEKQIYIHDHALDANYMVWADRFRIRQVLTNLGYNSIKYGKPGGYTKIRLTRAGNKVIVEVADNGIGIPREHLNRIFERFYRVEKSRSRDSGGSGLGLSICKHIIEAHGESISVLSTEGAGSVFSFSLKAYAEES